MGFWSGKKKKYYIPVLAVIAIIGFLAVFGDKGLVRIYKLSKERDSIRDYNERIRAENIAMKNEIDLLKNDDKYIELTARKELGMVGKDEMVYQFGKDKK